MKIAIRKAKKSDLGEIVELQKKQNLLHKTFDPMFYIPADNYEKKWIKSINRELNNKNNLLLVALSENIIVGFIQGGIKKRELRKVNKYGFIREIYVEEEYRGKNIGANLTNELIKWLKSKKISYIELTVDLKNKNAIKFYQNLGFKECDKTMKKDI